MEGDLATRFCEGHDLGALGGSTAAAGQVHRGVVVAHGVEVVGVGVLDLTDRKVPSTVPWLGALVDLAVNGEF